MTTNLKCLELGNKGSFFLSCARSFPLIMDSTWLHDSPLIWLRLIYLVKSHSFQTYNGPPSSSSLTFCTNTWLPSPAYIITSFWNSQHYIRAIVNIGTDTAGRPPLVWNKSPWLLPDRNWFSLKAICSTNFYIIISFFLPNQTPWCDYSFGLIQINSHTIGFQTLGEKLS